MCSKDEDCNINNICNNGICKHKPFLPVKSMDIFGLICILIFSGLSSTGGFGIIFVPFIILIFEFYMYETVPLSNIIVLFGALGSFIIHAQIPHPKRKSKAIEYNLVISITPNLLLGTVLGVNFKSAFSNVLVILIITVIMCYNSYKTGKM